MLPRALSILASAAAARAAAYPPPPPFLSNALGSHMVLQRDTSALIYGFAAPGVAVNTSMYGGPAAARFELQTIADGDGVWRQRLPAQPASRVDGTDSWGFNITSDVGDSASMVDVLFGDVAMCSGQSNM